MIGVSAPPADLAVAEEFFELFKTPWEPVVPSRKYRVVLSTDGRLESPNAEVLLAYGSTECAADREAGVAVRQLNGPTDVEWDGATFPIYGRAAAFSGGDRQGALRSGGEMLDHRHRAGSLSVWRIGYDLFGEVRHLLTKGQPPSRALTPTLELHIALLRHLLLESGVSFVEVPPRPAGCEFICCLTHDVDFFGIRRHGFDRTLAGFVARASVGTLADLVRGRRSLGEAARNWGALLSLPLVFLGLAPDFWRPVADYARADAGRPSTFFVVPFKNRPGVAPGGRVEPTRAVKYQASEVAFELQAAVGRGSEVAAHGIDAWRDADAGRAELAQVSAVTHRPTAGVRMHWLYFDAESPRRLEAAGFDYDSTWGYNEAVGHRAGTMQAFRPEGATRLMELPMSIMDSAMFYPGRMGLPEPDALALCRRVVADARCFGGTLVINWHDRSLAPERLWGRAYRGLIEEVQTGDRAWFATAADAVEWFRWRRSTRFGVAADGSVTVHTTSPRTGLPGGVVVVRRPAPRSHEEHRVDGEPRQLIA